VGLVICGGWGAVGIRLNYTVHAFLDRRREVIVACDCFIVLTVTFQWLYGFFVIEHRRRKILHCRVTRHPSADWIIQQLREAFPRAAPYR
jgi:hypothetical protein